MTSPKTLSILFVDDEADVEPMVRMKLRREIRKGAYDIAFAADGRDALALLSPARRAPEAVRAILERGPWEAAHLATALATAPTGGGSRNDATALAASRRHP